MCALFHRACLHSAARQPTDTRCAFVQVQTTSEDLRESFQRFGILNDYCVISERDSNRSRGFGFVSFANEQDALAAIDAMNE